MMEIIRAIIEIGIIWALIYGLLKFLQETQAGQLVKGLAFLCVVFFLAQQLKLEAINWILTKVLAISIIALVIIFQPELRSALMRLGRGRWFRFSDHHEVAQEIAIAIRRLSGRKTGAILAIERRDGLRGFTESGIPLDSRVTTELLETVFMPNGPLHDGGVIISGVRALAAACLFPISRNPKVEKTLGARHRAAIGITEETDAMAIVVSEETGRISVAMDGRLTQGLDPDAVLHALREIYGDLKQGPRWSVFSWLRGKPDG